MDLNNVRSSFVISVVDLSLERAEFLTQALQSREFQVQCYSKAPEAIADLANHTPHIIFIDYNTLKKRIKTLFKSLKLEVRKPV